jgi:hypothetical protein
MRKSLLIFYLLLCLYGVSDAQKLQYSRGTFQVADPNETQLVPDIKGFQHILTFTYNQKPSIYIFDPQLQLKEKKRLDFTIKKDCDIKLLPFADHYFVYMYLFKPSAHQIWKVDEKGNAVSYAVKLQVIVDSFFKQHTVPLQFINVDGGLYLTGNTYFDTIKSIRTTIVQLDHELNPLRLEKVLYPFDRSRETLHQTVLTANALFLLKTSRDNQKGNTLDVVKVQLHTNKIVGYSVNTGFHSYWSPAFVLNKDSSVLVYSILAERSQRIFLISRLGNELQELAPTTLLKSLFRQNTASDFISVQDQSLWLNLTVNRRIQRISGVRVSPGNYNSIERGTSSYRYGDYTGRNQPAAIRFSLLDSQFKIKKDSLVENDRKIIEVTSYPFAQFKTGTKTYLVLTQNFSAKRKGLLLVSQEDNDQLSMVSLPVYDRFDYLLNQLKSSDKNYFIVPYTNKNEMGLLKVSLKEN